MKWTLYKTVTHPRMKGAVVDSVHLHGPINRVVKNLKISAQVAIALKRDRKATWKDEKGGTVTLELVHVYPGGA